MRPREYPPEMEALVTAVDALRDLATSFEREAHMIGNDDRKWELEPEELRRMHARATAHRALADRLEFEALAVAKKNADR